MDNRLLHSTVEAFFPQNDEGFDMEPFTSAFGALLGKQLLQLVAILVQTLVGLA